MHDALLQPRAEGLYCPAGDFYIDPLLPVARAVITHAHGDHARIGSAHYHVAANGLALMRERLGAPARIEAHGFGQVFGLGEVDVSLHPSGHMLGAAQVRMEHAPRRWPRCGCRRTRTNTARIGPTRFTSPRRWSRRWRPWASRPNGSPSGSGMASARS